MRGQGQAKKEAEEETKRSLDSGLARALSEQKKKASYAVEKIAPDCTQSLNLRHNTRRIILPGYFRTFDLAWAARGTERSSSFPIFSKQSLQQHCSNNGTLKEILANRAELAPNSAAALSIVVYVVVES